MLFPTIDEFTELAMMFASIIAFSGTYIYMFRYNHRRWLCYIQLIAIAAIFVIYSLLFLNIEPLNSDLDLRADVVRIVLFLLLTSFGLDRMNGRLARLYNKLSPR